MKKLHLFVPVGILLMIFLAACGGLAGEPEIVGQMPVQPTAATVSLQAPSSAPDLALGATVFAENCIRCHGETGAGDGEFVQSGQITNIPNFTDPAQHEGRSPVEYYTMVTNGNLANLMPPFVDSLTDEQRWSVANYVFTLAGGDAPEYVPELEDVTPSESPHNTETVDTTDEVVAGTVSGSILQGTVGAAVPDTGTVTLAIVQMSGMQTYSEVELNADGTYQFTDVPIIPDAQYLVSMDYGSGTFHSEFAPLTPVSPDINLNIVIYETTDDDSVIVLEVVLTQIDVLDENTLQIWQLISVVNTSDRLYVYSLENGESVSVEVPAPAGVQLSPEIDLARFAFAENAVYDTRPVIPGTDHSFHLIYTVPFDSAVTFSQNFPYALIGPYEAYVDSSVLRLIPGSWDEIDAPQTVGGITYEGIVKSNGALPGEPISFTIRKKGFKLDRQFLGYVVIAVGLIFIVVSGLFYRFAPAPSATTADTETVQSLMKEIAALDDKFEQGAIKKKEYDRQRKALKDRVTALMQSEKG